MSLLYKLWIVMMLGAIQWRPGSCCSGEEKNSHLWQIGTSPPSYLFGTIHAPYNKLWSNIPENVKVAFASSHDVFLELDWTDEATNRAINNCQLLPNNETIGKHLSPRVFARLEKYMTKLQAEIPRWYGGKTREDELVKNLLGGWQYKRPIWITLLLSSMNKESVRSTASGTPLLDVFLGNAAYNLGKKLEAMEKVDDQCNPFNRLNAKQAEYILKKELDFLDQQGFKGGSESAERSVNFYTCGDFEQMITSQSLLPIPIHDTHNKRQKQLVNNIEKVLTTHMVLKRNRKMARRLLSTIKSNPNQTHFFAIGAGHLVGNNSVIDYLRKRRLSVIHLSSNTTILKGKQLPEDFESLGKKKIIPQSIDLSAYFTTAATQATSTTKGDSATESFNVHDILELSGTTRPTYSITLGPFFTMPTTSAPTATMTTTSSTTAEPPTQLQNNINTTTTTDLDAASKDVLLTSGANKTCTASSTTLRILAVSLLTVYASLLT